MPDDIIDRYIDKHIRKGVHPAKIKSTLLKAGHKPKKVDKVLAAVHHTHHTEKIVAMFAFLAIIIAFIFIYGTEEIAQVQKSVAKEEPGKLSPSELVFGINDFKTNAPIVDGTVHLTQAGDYVEIDVPQGSYSKLAISAKAESFIAQTRKVLEWREMSKEEYIAYLRENGAPEEKTQKTTESPQKTYSVPSKTELIEKESWPFIELWTNPKKPASIRISSIEFTDMAISLGASLPESIKLKIPDFEDESKQRNVYIKTIKLTG